MVGLSGIWIAELSVSCCVHCILEVLDRTDGEGVAVSLVKESVVNLRPCLDAPGVSTSDSCLSMIDIEYE